MPICANGSGFISNPEEERFLNSKEGIQKLARALYKGFCAYRNRHYADAGPLLQDAAPAGSERALAATEDATSAREADRALAVDAMSAPAPAVVGVVPVATRAFRGGKRPVMNPAAPQRAVRPWCLRPHRRKSLKNAKPWRWSKRLWPMFPLRRPRLLLVRS